MITETSPSTDIQSDLQNDVHWNLADLFDGIDDPRIADNFVRSMTRAAAFQEMYKSKINVPDLTAETLGAALREYEDLEQDAAKPAVFASLLFSTDTGDPARGAFLQKVREQGTQISLLLLFFDLELAAVPASILDPLLNTDAVRSYAHYVRSVRLYREHLLPENEERLLEEVANTGGRAFVRLFSQVTSNATFRFRGADVTQSEVLAHLYASDRDERRDAAAAFSEGLRVSLPTVVYVFNTLLQDKNVKDRLRGYAYPEQSRHMANELPPETVELVVGTVVDNYPLVNRFYKVKREILGIDQITHYDRYAPLFASEGVVPFPDARQIVLEAFGDFSPDMRARASDFFDKGWIDAPPAKGKQGGAYCQGVTPDLHPYVFLNYMGRMRDVMTLAHELGHGVHDHLAQRQSLLNYHGTLPLAELASTFGEMLVFQRIVKDAPLKERLALYAEKIDDCFSTIPRQTALYRFEQSIHKQRREGGELSAEQFGDLWQASVGEMFGDSVALGDEHRDWWSYVGHFVRTPFYVYAYSFGELLALSLFRQAQTGGPEFAQKYLQMLSCGGSLTPQELMAQVGVDLNDAAFWAGGFQVLEDLVSQFEALWAEYKDAGHS